MDDSERSVLIAQGSIEDALDRDIRDQSRERTSTSSIQMLGIPTIIEVVERVAPSH